MPDSSAILSCYIHYACSINTLLTLIFLNICDSLNSCLHCINSLTPVSQSARHLYGKNRCFDSRRAIVGLASVRRLTIRAN